MTLAKLLTEREERLLNQERQALRQLSGHLRSVELTEEDAKQFEASIGQLDEMFLLIVAGEFNAGKSAFINALLGEPILKVGVTPTTDRITVLSYGEARRSEKDKQARPHQDVEDVELIRAPVPLLETINIVDTPGTNAIHREHEALTKEFIPRADMVLFVTSADRPFTESERQFLERIREWGKKVAIVVNKRDLLETPEDLEQVLDFVQDNGRLLLEDEPHVFAVSAKLAATAVAAANELELEQSGLPALESYISKTLDDRGRIRLKLLNPVGVGVALAEKYRSVVQTQLDLLKEDVRMLDEVDRQLAAYVDDQNRDFTYRLADVDNALLDFEKRGNEYFEETLRLGRVFDLVNKDRIKAEFERKVIADLPLVVEKKVVSVIDWMVETELKQWKGVSEHLEKRQEAHQDRMLGRLARTFSQDRKQLLDTVGTAALRAVESYDKDHESSRLAESVKTAVAGTALLEVGAISLGTLVTLIATSTAADVSGILAAGAISILGLLVLPAKRRHAKRELRQKVAEVRSKLMGALKEQFEREMGKSVQRIEEAMAPYTRFVRSERDHLQQSAESLQSDVNALVSLRAQIESAALRSERSRAER